MPDPMRTSTRPSTSSAISASRTDGLETPSCLARSRSGGSRAPAGNSPERDQLADLIGDLPIQSARFDTLEGHGEAGSGTRGSDGPPNARSRPAGRSMTLAEG